MKFFGKWRKDPPADEQVFTAPQAGGAANTVIVGRGNALIGKGRKILVVDDNAVVVKTFELKLKSCGFEVSSEAEGSAALSTARMMKPDLIVLDINFPPDVGNSGLQWDGFNIMQWLGRFKEVATIPVIIITSGSPEQYKARSLAAGAVDFFQKPIKFDEFLAAVDRITTRKSDPVEAA